MEKSVCIVTSEESFHNNYGAALQGYALFTTISGMGYKPKIIRYKGGMQPRYRDMNIKGKLRYKLIKIYHYLFKNKEQRLSIRIFKKYIKEIRSREQLFLSFQDSFMDFYDSKRVGWYDLKENPPVADIYVCGSDQIWNPYFKGGKNDLGYFLDFALPNKKRIAYAPSFGCPKLPDKARENIPELLNKFAFISVREKEGANIVFESIKKKVPVVADPTLLLTKEQWNDIATIPSNIPKEYILCYRFSNNCETKKAIDKLGIQLNLPIISLPLTYVSMNDDYSKIFNAGPTDFIGLIKNAKLICTDSFHAAVFSIIFNKAFYVFPRENFHKSSANMNSRILNLLSISNLRDRFVTTYKDIKLDRMFAIDYSETNIEIKKFRIFSKEWLSNAMVN